MSFVQGERDVPKDFVDKTETWLYFRRLDDYEQPIRKAQLEFQFEFRQDGTLQF